MIVRLSDSIRSLNVPLRAAVLEFSVSEVLRSSDYINEQFDRTVMETADVYSLATLSKDRVMRLVRDLFKACGTDPTRWRPSSEAMIRRVLKSKDLYRINPIVDINNIVSIRYRLPIGLYDTTMVKGSINISVGNEGETMKGLTGRDYNMQSKPVVKDNSGIIGSPIVDSERTKIRDDTRHVVAIIFSHLEEPEGLALSAAEEFKKHIEKSDPGANIDKIKTIAVGIQ